MRSRKPQGIGRAPARDRQRTPFTDADAAAVAAAVGALDVQTPGAQTPDLETLGVPGLVARRGRILSDGSRRGAGIVAKRTVYFEPEVARALDSYAHVHGKTLGVVLAEALAKAGIGKVSA